MSKSKFAKRKDPLDINKWHPRDVINARLEQLGKTKYWLVARAGSSEAVVYRYLGGEAETTCENVRQMLRACGLQMTLTVPDGFDPESPMKP